MLEPSNAGNGQKERQARVSTSQYCRSFGMGLARRGWVFVAILSILFVEWPGRVSGGPRETGRELVAGGVTIRDRMGAKRIILSSDQNDKASVSVSDVRNESRVDLSVTESGVALVSFTDRHFKVRIDLGISVDKGGRDFPYLSLRSKKEEIRAILSSRDWDDTSILSLFNDDGTDGVYLAAIRDKAGVLDFNTREVEDCLVIGLSESEDASLHVQGFDEADFARVEAWKQGGSGFLVRSADNALRLWIDPNGDPDIGITHHDKPR